MPDCDDAPLDLETFDRLLASAPNQDAIKFYFNRHAASGIVLDALRHNLQGSDEDDEARRTRMDRLSAIFQHIHIATLPRHHFGMLDHYRSSPLQTEGASSNNSFGKYLHVNGEQVMESWETQWMRALARYGLRKTRSASAEGPVRVLELGWGQGISGRELLAGWNVNYTVIEIHPGVAANARKFFEDHGMSSHARVLEGAWEEVFPTLKDRTFDVVFADTWDTTRAKGRQAWEFREPWYFNAYESCFVSLYRMLKPEGVLVYYDTGLRETYAGSSVTQKTLTWQPSLFNEVDIRKVGGLHAYGSTTYVENGFNEAVLPALRK